ncbi:hypothetical protein CFREI_01990 [Corynebacterium freiburgense]|nr:hypothetical protein CFREI_01990 [Corynebacterium freiburgense]
MVLGVVWEGCGFGDGGVGGLWAGPWESFGRAWVMPGVGPG